MRIIYRDWPIFGPASERAARVAIASQWQDKHSAFHDALMTTTQPLNEAKIRAAATSSGIVWSQLETDLKVHSGDIEALLKRNADQAEQLGLEGTPGFIIGNVQSFGGMSVVDPTSEASVRDPKLVGLIVRAYAARAQLVGLDITAPRELRRELARVARASFLAPDIVTAIFKGTQPGALRARKIERGELPLCWKAQREILGFS